MPDYVTLLGADDVRAAGSQMRSAAEQMSNAAASIDESLRRNQMFLDDWLIRFEQALASAAAKHSCEPGRTEGE